MRECSHSLSVTLEYHHLFVVVVVVLVIVIVIVVAADYMFRFLLA